MKYFPPFKSIKMHFIQYNFILFYFYNNIVFVYFIIDFYFRMLFFIMAFYFRQF